MMNQIFTKAPSGLWLRGALLLGLAGTLAAVVLAPGQVGATLRFVATSLVEVAPLVAPGLVVSASVSASGAGGHVAAAFGGRMVPAVLAASAVGAITPVCGVTVLPLMAGLLASGVPLAPVMAFWLSSPVTDPAMLAATAATLGFGFAVGKTLAAFGLGLLGGTATAALGTRRWSHDPLRRNRFVGKLGASACKSVCGSASFDPKVWRSADRRGQFCHELRAMAIFPVLRFRPFMLYQALAVTGSMAAGWIYGLLA